jgi:hypothetical protein
VWVGVGVLVKVFVITKVLVGVFENVTVGVQGLSSNAYPVLTVAKLSPMTVIAMDRLSMRYNQQGGAKLT